RHVLTPTRVESPPARPLFYRPRPSSPPSRTSPVPTISFARDRPMLESSPMDLDLLRELSVTNDTKILLVVIDGLGGLPNESGRSELEQANIPHLDRLAIESLCGMTVPVAAGVTPGSGPGHLALFG